MLERAPTGIFDRTQKKKGETAECAELLNYD